MFNVYPDISLAIHYARRWHPLQAKRIMFINTSCTQANGVTRDNYKDPDMYILDVYDPTVEPHDVGARTGVHCGVTVGQFDNDESYVTKIRHKVNYAIGAHAPDFVIYNAGYDVSHGDRVGKMSISESTIILRDEMIFREVMEQSGIPILMTVGSCYKKYMEGVVARSIRNLIVKLGLSQKTLQATAAQNIRLAQKLQRREDRFANIEYGDGGEFSSRRGTTFGGGTSIHTRGAPGEVGGAPLRGRSVRTRTKGTDVFKQIDFEGLEDAEEERFTQMKKQLRKGLYNPHEIGVIDKYLLR
jgi:hypothetical protein